LSPIDHGLRGVGELLWIEWLAVLADNQNQFLGRDINTREEVRL